jgi:1,3-beta-glucanosyltransferase GAS5
LEIFTDPFSLSEYGCITHTRTWQETAALFNAEMTAVYSGGLAYEYSMEANGYGMVTINSDGSITEDPSFGTYETALANNPAPSGDGGYNATGGASPCPPQDPNWNVTSDALPAIPSNALAYMTNGAGKGPGLNGPGSQDAGGSGTSTGTAAPGSGSVTAVATGTATKKSAAVGGPRPLDQSPIIVGAIVLGCTVLGGMLL